MNKEDIIINNTKFEPKTIFGTLKVLENLLLQAQLNNGRIEVTDALLEDLIENTNQEYIAIYNMGKL